MGALTLFGLVAVVTMLACYALEDRGAGYVLGFAAACVLPSVYGFLQGAWPFEEWRSSAAGREDAARPLAHQSVIRIIYIMENNIIYTL